MIPLPAKAPPAVAGRWRRLWAPLVDRGPAGHQKAFIGEGASQAPQAPTSAACTQTCAAPQTAEYTELIRRRDADAIMELLTDRAVELKVGGTQAS